jgi:hypothetical protein
MRWRLVSTRTSVIESLRFADSRPLSWAWSVPSRRMFVALPRCLSSICSTRGLSRLFAAETPSRNWK